jgi:hypothetical protein
MLDKGYLIIANQSPEVDYLCCARVLAKSIRLYHPTADITLASNDAEPSLVFDRVVPLPHPMIADNPFSYDWQSYEVSPYHETIKLEADMVITQPIDHWWTLLRKREMVVSTGCYDFRGKLATSRHYRRIFDENGLPDAYNAITYWRKSQLAQDFFRLCSFLYAAWPQVATTLRFAKSDTGSTDLVYAVACRLLGVERTTLPATYPKIVHMKQAINRLQTQDWTKELIWEIERDNFRINTIAQRHPVHYHIKDFAKTLEPLYDQFLEGARRSSATNDRAT